MFSNQDLAANPLIPKHTPFTIPEILEKILAYLDQRTLSSSAILVSRGWFHSARHLIAHELIWHDGWDNNSDRLERVLSRLPWLTRVHWDASRFGVNVRKSQQQQWNSFIRALGAIQRQHHHQRLQLQESTRPHECDNSNSNSNNSFIALTCDLEGSHLFPRRTLQSCVLLQEIELSGDCSQQMMQSLLPNLSYLTKLTLRFASNVTLYPSSIFTSCEQLQDLHISSEEKAILKEPWIGQQPRQTVLPLRSLVLSNAHFQQLHLEGLLTVTPHLKRLKVLNPHQYEYSHLTVFETTSYNASQLVRHIKTLSLKLNYFHFTSGWADVTPWVCPNASERTFWRDDFNSDIEKAIRSQHNVVTSLELMSHQPKDFQAPTSALHRFLCSAPHLLHLRAPQLGYQLEHMDIHGRLAFTTRLPMDFRPKTFNATTTTTTRTTKMTPTYPPGIWACRNLQTLHIRIRAPNDTDGYAGSHRPLYSRIALGYLARVCPNLRDLNLTNYRNSFARGASVDLRLVGGLCFLSRLQYLERLRIEYWGETVAVQPWDVKWMIDEGRTLERREERRRVMTRWAGLIETEESIRALARSRNDDPPPLNWSITRYDPGMKEALRHLGSLLDVQLAVQEMDNTDEASHHDKGHGGLRRYFPVLRYASFAAEVEIEVPLEVEVKRLLAAMKAKPKG